MDASMEKTKVMIIQKQKSRAQFTKNKTWKIGDKEVDECVTYKYLGVTLNRTGLSQNTSLELRRKLIRPIAKSKEWVGFQPCLFLYLFDHTIVPILNYATEIWGFEEWSKLETLHKKACKYALGI